MLMCSMDWCFFLCVPVSRRPARNPALDTLCCPPPPAMILCCRLLALSQVVKEEVEARWTSEVSQQTPALGIFASFRF